MKLPVHIRQSSTHGAVQAFCPDLPGCSASAPSVEQALELLKRRVDDYFAASARRAPAGTRIVTLEV
jgi:predicted RNase H-like HicB family nuclease